VQTEIYWIHDFQPGRLAIMPCPQGGERLEDEIRFLANLDVNVLVSLLTRDDALDYELVDESELCDRFGLEYLSFPIADHQVPGSITDVAALVDNLADRLARGKNIAIHCLAGIGRSGLIAACLLTTAGFPPKQAFDKLSHTRGFTAPETDEQREWVIDFADSHGFGV
jgi:protein-tyrosine phosphatase